jgi:hypothetical protein
MEDISYKNQLIEYYGALMGTIYYYKLYHSYSNKYILIMLYGLSV